MISTDRSRLVGRVRTAAAVLGLLCLTVLVVWYLWARPDPASMAALGYPGIALAMFVTSSTIFLPAPGFAAVLMAGAVWDPFWVGIAAGIGGGAGELSGYLLGAGGNALLEFKGSQRWEQAHRLFKKYGLGAILVLAIVPNPLFDAVGILCGSLSYPILRFWLVCTVGKSIKFLAIAYLAGGAVGWWGAK